ncbi:DUF1501 domain-containing protein [Mycolicibacterium palauense]|uniref:DUF1501 domain-containing protein n=1 Tax=Mycolicibacterium palauense TaxID=2034511 RepID=UPI000BFF1317|nr:twin-arginine translocation signal domain-containing protein [Mycolicibacterium palauense]
MSSLSRRTFLHSCAAAVAAAGLAPAASVAWSDLALAASENPLHGDSGILVLITLGGGNDGLNTLIPYGDDTYYDSRSDLAIASEKVLALDDGLGLNPVMQGLSKLYDRKSLAIVRGVGYPEPDHSHFRSMDIWQSGSTDNGVTTGWIGRWLDATGADPLRALNIGSLVPRLAVGEKATAASLSTDTFPSSDTRALVHRLGGVCQLRTRWLMMIAARVTPPR